ncbi:MAG TPA: phosphomannomutase [Polyangiaceae bacterium]|jgi:phosphomannomutase|nr:phosphomannomutase [Polyangiaceae bacterium]
MDSSGVAFGTSGARGLVSAMTDEVCYTYTRGFLQYLEREGEIQRGGRVAVAGDLRSSTPRIMRAVMKAIADHGSVPVTGGRVPTPALALYGFAQKIPSIMVTGSHIPDDRNGIKFYRPKSELLKRDEPGMKEQVVELPPDFDAKGATLHSAQRLEPSVLPEIERHYVQRYFDAFGPGALRGARIGLFEHSAVGRDLFFEVLSGLGAEVTRLGRSEAFIPVDTEAIRPEDVASAARWATEHQFDTIVSTDGDSDRPLVSDEHGKWLRGDVAGILTAKFLGATFVAAPVSCNTAVEKSGAFRRVVRTRIGSPYVIEAMNGALGGAEKVVGYEANGGFLTATDFSLAGPLPALPTRDAFLVPLAVLLSARAQGTSISRLLQTLPQRFTASDRLEDFPTALSKERLGALAQGGAEAIAAAFPAFGPVADVSTVDGLRVTFASDEVVHLRASGNAPELRCYTEAASEARSVELNEEALTVLRGWR